MTSKIALFTLSALLLGAVSAAHAQAPSQPSAPRLFEKIDVQHYDAGMMAELATRQDAIVVIPPNFVVPGGGFAPVLSGGPALRSGPNNLPAAPPVPPANNRLPDGVERIYALQSNNTLVIQRTPATQHTPFAFSPIH